MKIRTKTPCCGRGIVLTVTAHVPVETYERICKNARWTIRRETITDEPKGKMLRADKLEWLAVFA